MTIRLMTLALTVATIACSRNSRNSRSASAVRLDGVRPDSVMLASGAVVEVVLNGSGFIPGPPGQNTVMFGNHAITDVPANSEGTQIRFVIPEALPSGGGAPPLPIDAGSYAIRVRTAAGESKAATLRVFR